MNVRDKLSVAPASPHYDRAACLRVDYVEVNGVRLAACQAYCISEGWAIEKVGRDIGPKQYGVITVILKGSEP